jgi:hypothetical protein
LLGAKAVYLLHEGDERREVYSSAFTDTIIIEGYGNTEEHTVEIFAIDKSNNLSEGVKVTVKPLTPPIQLIRKTLGVIESFGSVHTYWDNEEKKDIVITLYTVDKNGDHVLQENYFTNTSGAYSFKGLAPEQQKFHIEMRDRWGNPAASLDTVLTPMIRENVYGRETVNGSPVVFWTQYGYNFGADTTYKYRGDLGPSSSTTRGFQLLYNDYLFGDGDTYWQINTNLPDYFNDGNPNMPWPFYFTIDMGRKAAYSDMRVWMRNRSSLGSIYSARIMSVFDIWATNNPKAVEEIGDKEANLRYWTSWDRVGGTDAWKNDWVKIASCRLVLPSGITKASQTNLTDADKAYVQGGFPFDMDPRIGNQAFRYLRFEIKETNTDASGLDICELRFWGMIER